MKDSNIAVLVPAGHVSDVPAGSTHALPPVRSMDDLPDIVPSGWYRAQLRKLLGLKP